MKPERKCSVTFVINYLAVVHPGLYMLSFQSRTTVVSLIIYAHTLAVLSHFFPHTVVPHSHHLSPRSSVNLPCSSSLLQVNEICDKVVWNWGIAGTNKEASITEYALKSHCTD